MGLVNLTPSKRAERCSTKTIIGRYISPTVGKVSSVLQATISLPYHPFRLARIFKLRLHTQTLSHISKIAMAPQLLELDSVEIQVIIDNELDPISPSPNPSVTQTGGMRTIGMNGPDISTDSKRAGAVKELRMDHICCSVHGLSLLITGHRRDQSHTILFDTGPEESAWERNAKRLKADVGSIERVVLSHWHRDHSGGMLKVLSMINEARSTNTTSLPQEPVHVDLHPSRPEYRGMQPPDLPVVSLEADPTFAEIGSTGAVVDRRSDAHTVLSDFFLVSGEIPRVTEYEKGLKFGMRLDEGKDKWEQDEEVADERFLMCKIKGMLRSLSRL